MGFPAPLNLWMKNNHSEFRKELASSLDTGLFNENILTEFDKQKRVAYRDYLAFWRAIAVAKWMKKFNVARP